MGAADATMCYKCQAVAYYLWFQDVFVGGYRFFGLGLLSIRLLELLV